MKRTLLAPALALLLATLMLSQCGATRETPTSRLQPTQSPTLNPTPSAPTPLDEIVPLSTTQSLIIERIEDEGFWTNGGRLIRESYTLFRQEENFEGTAEYRVGQSSPFPEHSSLGGQAKEQITIPTEAVDEFLKALGSLPVIERAYIHPPGICTDCPLFYISIRLVTSSTEVQLFVESAHDFSGIPWAVVVEGRSYVIESHEPLATLALLQPYLQSDVLMKLIDEFAP